MRAYSIKDAKKNTEQLTALFLRQVSGSELSMLLPQLRQLKILDLSDNQLDQLPDGMESLEQLEHLILNNNRLKKLPTELPATLKKLEIRYNAIDQWPEALNQLPFLEVLDLSGNLLTEASFQKSRLQHLRFLGLHNNKLKSLPKDWKTLKSLKVLDVSANNIQQVPPFFSQLKGLEKLDLAYNQIRQLPSGIGKCKQLSDLGLQYNALSKIPAGLFKLTFLRTLNLAHNELKSIPGRIGQLSWLAQLDLSHNQFSRLPPGIGQCRQLQILALNNNRLNSLPSTLEQLKKLQRIQLEHNRLKRLPGLPRSLEELSLAHNSFAKFPSTLHQLNRLKKLNISENPIKKLPRTVKRMDAMVSLNLQKCSTSFQLASLLHLPAVEKIKCDRLSEDQMALLADILRLPGQVSLSFPQKKELFSASEKPEKIPLSTLVHILNQAGPTLSYSIRKKLIREAPELPPGSKIGLVGQSNPVLDHWMPKLKDWEISMSIQLSNSTHFLLGEPPYPALSEKDLHHKTWLNMRQLLDFAHVKSDSEMSADQRRTIGRLIESKYEEQHKLGIQLIYGVGIDDMMWAFLFRIFQEKPDGMLKEKLLPLLEAYAKEGQRRDLLLSLNGSTG